MVAKKFCDSRIGVQKMDTDINYIIQESLKGNKKSQEILLNKLHPLIYKNIYIYYSQDDHIVEDLVQEGYVVILKSLKSYEENKGVHFLGYVKTNLFYFYKNYYRDTKNQRKTISLNQNIGEQNNSQEIGSIMIGCALDPIEEVLLKDEINELFNNIKKLSKKEQKILNMFYIDELEIKEISNHLQKAYRTVVWRKYIALKKLKELMGGDNNGGAF
jgi:RNA polymerase sigma factor (sigma-70 family)